MGVEKLYSASQVVQYINEALHHNNINRIYSVELDNGNLVFRNAIPGVHWLRHKQTRAEMQVKAADDMVIVCENKSGITEIIYSHDLGDYEIIARKQSVQTAPGSVGLDDVPGTGSVYTHRSGRVYLVFGVLNLNRNSDKRAKGEYEEIVCYVGANGNLWGKTLSNFNETMTLGGRFEFNDGVQMEYMGVVENGVLSEGFMTRDIKALLESIESEPN